MKELFTFLHLSSPNLIENDYNFVFLAIKYQLSNTLNHVCFEKLPRSWEFMHKWRCLGMHKNWANIEDFGSWGVTEFKGFGPPHTKGAPIWSHCWLPFTQKLAEHTVGWKCQKALCIHYLSSILWIIIMIRVVSLL